MKTKTLHFEFQENGEINGQKAFVLLLNEGVCLGYPKSRFSREAAKESADAHVKSYQDAGLPVTYK
jgi:hypothetical protein